MKYILIKFDDVHCTILENGKGDQCICETKVDAVRLQAKHKDYIIIPMTDIISLIESTRITANEFKWYHSVSDIINRLNEILFTFNEI